MDVPVLRELDACNKIISPQVELKPRGRRGELPEKDRWIGVEVSATFA
jgi:hypothetical protein